jgi:hypothetical protein
VNKEGNLKKILVSTGKGVWIVHPIFVNQVSSDLDTRKMKVVYNEPPTFPLNI